MIQNQGGSVPTGLTPPLRSMSTSMVYAAMTKPTM
jgi:hypothetical protein